jgi:hypothetical protein
MTTRPRGFYVAYIERLIADREARGEPAPDIAPESYWRQRERDTNHLIPSRTRARPTQGATQ